MGIHYKIRTLILLILVILGMVGSCRAFETSPEEQKLKPKILREVLAVQSYPLLEDQISKIWDFVQVNANLTFSPPPPVIYFAPFIFEKEDLEWIQWQKIWITTHPSIWEDWRANNPEATPPHNGNPFPSNFYAFSYDGTNRIQVNPYRTFIPNIVGSGYYVVGHELHHYALEQLGLPGELHHCLFLKQRNENRKSLMDSLADFLVINKISGALLYNKNLNDERQLNPCARLTPGQIILVEENLNKI